MEKRKPKRPFIRLYRSIKAVLNFNPCGGIFGGSSPSQRLKETDNTTQEKPTGCIMPVVFGVKRAPRTMSKRGTETATGVLYPFGGELCPVNYARTDLNAVF